MPISGKVVWFQIMVVLLSRPLYPEVCRGNSCSVISMMLVHSSRSRSLNTGASSSTSHIAPSMLEEVSSGQVMR